MVVAVTIPPKNPVMATGRPGGRDCDETNQAPMRSLPARPAPVNSRPVGDRSTARTSTPRPRRAVSRKQGSAHPPTASILTVVTVTGRPDRRHDAGVGQTLGVADGTILNVLVGVMYQGGQVAILASSGPDRHVEGNRRAHPNSQQPGASRKPGAIQATRSSRSWERSGLHPAGQRPGSRNRPEVPTEQES